MEETDLTYEGIETQWPRTSCTRPHLEETDLTYEGIETRTWCLRIEYAGNHEETDLTYEGIETYAVSHAEVSRDGQKKPT